MAFAFKNKDFNVTTTEQEVFTAPANTQVIIIGLRISNKSNNNSEVTVRRFSVADQADYHVSGEQTIVPVGSALNVADGNRIVLTSGDKLKVQGSANGELDLSLDYLELT